MCLGVNQGEEFIVWKIIARNYRKTRSERTAGANKRHFCPIFHYLQTILCFPCPAVTCVVVQDFELELCVPETQFFSGARHLFPNV